MQIKVCDRVSYAVNTDRVYTDGGFLVVPGRVARTGVQEYLASELGLTDRNPNDIIKVERPECSVFEQASLDSYVGTDVTIEHPSTMVNAESFDRVSKGVITSAGKREGDFVVVDMIIKSRDAITAVESGKVQLSAGYTAIYDEAPKDSPFDFIQREIRINHVALVDRARAGAQARLFDNNPGVPKMFKATLDSGRTIEVQDDATAILVSDSIARLEKRAVDAEKATSDISEENERTTAERDAAIEERDRFKENASDAAITARLTALAGIMDNARKIAGSDFTCDSVNPLDVQRAALTKTRDSVKWADKSDVYVTAAFDMAIENVGDASPGQLEQFAIDTALVTAPDEVKISSYDKHKAEMSTAWKKGK